MRLIIDSNRLMAGLLRSSICIQIILSDQFTFYAPDYILIEIIKNQDYLLKKSGLTEEDFNFILYSLLERINLIPFEEFWDEFDQAVEIMKSIDEKDAPFMAAGMYLKADGIWTEDNDFKKQKILKAYSTKNLFERIQNK